MLRSLVRMFLNQNGFFLALEVFLAFAISVIFWNPVLNWLCRRVYDQPAVNHIEIYPKRIRLGDNVTLIPAVEVPCGGKPDWDWSGTTHGVVGGDSPRFTLSTQGVREEVPFNIHVGLKITDKCDNKSTEYRAPAPIEVVGPPRPRIINVEPDSLRVWKGDPVVLTATADQPGLRYEWQVPGTNIDGNQNDFRVRLRISGIPNPMGYIPITGSCTAITREGERSDPKDFSFWVWETVVRSFQRPARGGYRSPRPRPQQTLTPPGAPPPPGANTNQAPAQTSPPPPTTTNQGGATGATTPQTPPAPAAKPSP